MAGPIHYEVYVRKSAPSSWTLLIATEDRKHAIETAEEQLRDRLAIASRVTKETLDPDTMEFASVVVLTRGAPEVKRKAPVREDSRGPSCRGVQDLYAPHARDLIGRVLEDWLNRQGVTAFELLHRPDLAERLRPRASNCSTRSRRSPCPRARIRARRSTTWCATISGSANRRSSGCCRLGGATSFPVWRSVRSRTWLIG